MVAPLSCPPIAWNHTTCTHVQGGDTAPAVAHAASKADKAANQVSAGMRALNVALPLILLGVAIGANYYLSSQAGRQNS